MPRSRGFQGGLPVHLANLSKCREMTCFDHEWPDRTRSLSCFTRHHSAPEKTRSPRANGHEPSPNWTHFGNLFWIRSVKSRHCTMGREVGRSGLGDQNRSGLISLGAILIYIEPTPFRTGKNTISTYIGPGAVLKPGAVWHPATPWIGLNSEIRGTILRASPLHSPVSGVGRVGGVFHRSLNSNLSMGSRDDLF